MDQDDRRYMEAALAQARLSKPEDDSGRPRVGAVVVATDGAVVGQAFRGETGRGDHAEYGLLEGKLNTAVLAGSTVYTTLEPCTTRRHPKVPCARRLIERRVARVVVGMLDPNPNILGRGILQLRDAGVAVEFFPPDLMAELEELNRDFRRVHSTGASPPISDELLRVLSSQALDAWYVAINTMYWNRNFQREPMAVFAHLAELVGSLSVLVSKKKAKDDIPRYMAKTLAWWLALCGKVGVKSSVAILWGKFPYACPYCHSCPCQPDDCSERKRKSRGPDWVHLDELGRLHRERQPRTIAEWQRMFGTIYPVVSTEGYERTFAKLTEELGELAEAMRVFPAAPGYFLSESADVFAWLMKLNNLVEAEAEVRREDRGNTLQRVFAETYPARCTDCHSALCTCPAILESTIGRIAHEVPPDRSSYGDTGSFVTSERLAVMFRPKA